MKKLRYVTPIKTSSILILIFTLLLFPIKAHAVNTTGRWNVPGQSEGGTIKFSFPAEGGSISGGEFFGGGGGQDYTMEYGGRFSGSFSGGWSGTFSGTFYGWVSMNYLDPSTEEYTKIDKKVGGSWSGSINPDGTGRAYFDNEAQGGDSGNASFSFSKSAFEREYGASFVEEEVEKAVEDYEEYEEEEKEATFTKESTEDDGLEREQWEIDYLTEREAQREERRRSWFRSRYTISRLDPMYSPSRDDDSHFFASNIMRIVDTAEEHNDRVTIQVIKVLNVIEDAFMEAFAPTDQKDPT